MNAFDLTETEDYAFELADVEPIDLELPELSLDDLEVNLDPHADFEASQA